MDVDDSLDLEELESRLYSQIYHSSVEPVEELEANNIVSCDFQVNNYRKNYRYFENSDILVEPQSFIPLTNIYESISSLAQNTKETDFSREASSSAINKETNISRERVISLSPNSITNNITLNQYSIPFVVNGHSFLSSNPYTHISTFPPWFTEESVTNGRSKNSKNKKKKKKTSNLLQKPINKNTVIVYISDSDSDDCVAVVEEDMLGHNINTKFPKKYNEADGDRLPELDDDVIFIPPPPVEVISVDVDDKSLKNVDKLVHSKKLVIEDNSKCEERLEASTALESSVSNDFLETANIEPTDSTNFNFGLHGSDFNNGTSELGQAAKSTEYCETESSCSTNEHSRDFSNTVKTIVFDEIEFPKEDIFSEKSLESFGLFITPKRSLSKAKESVKKTKELKTTNEHIDNSSDVSSSESDYETNVNKKIENLPNLSPMVVCDNINNISGRCKKTDSDFSSKKKKKESQQQVDKCKKKKRALENENSKATEIEIFNSNVTTSTPNSKSKRKKKKREHDASTSLMENSVIDISLDGNEKDNSEKLKKKKKRRSSSTPNNISQCNPKELDDPIIIDLIENCTPDEHTVNSREAHVNVNQFQDSEKSKNKKKKRTISVPSNLTDCFVSLEQGNYKSTAFETISHLDTSEKSKKKKKKRGNVSECSIDEISGGEKSSPNINLKADTLNDEVDNSLKDINKFSPAAGKLKENKNEGVSDNSLEVNISESELIQRECNRKVDVTSQTNKDGDISLKIDVVKETDTSKELVESDSDKAKKRRRKKDSGGDISSEKMSQNIVEIEQSKEDMIYEKNDNLHRNTETQINVPTSNEENSNTIILDSDSSSDGNSEVIISSDSDYDFETLDDVECDLSLNYLDKNTVLDTTENSINNQEYQRLIDNIRAPLEDYEKYDVDTVQSQQSDNPDKWIISYKDRATYLNYGGNKGPRCNRCRHFGHIGLRCPDKRYPTPCSLCGGPDHQEPRCPNKRCTQCGNRGDYSTTYCYKCFKFRHTICNLCKMVGHIENSCPDLWRRYHLTTDQEPMVTHQGQMKPRNQQWCSGCAKQGHLEHECNYYNRGFPPTTPYIMRYEDNLEHNKQIAAQENVLSSTNVPPTLEFKMQTPNVSITTQGSGNAEIPSLLNLSVPVPAFNVAPTVNRIIFPNMSTPNLTIQVSNDPQNQPTAEHPNNEIIFRMDLNLSKAEYTPPTERDNSVNLCDINQIKKLMMSMPHHVVTDFLRKQMDHLSKNKIDLRLLKRKIFKFDKLVDNKRNIPEKILHQKDYWYRLLNMFVFGIHKHKDGKLHMNYLQRFLSKADTVRLNSHKRMSLFSSYSYIFGCDQHPNVNYYKILRLLIRKYCNNNNVVL